jgi:dGTPase
MFRLMFERYCEELKTENMSSEIYGEYLRGMSEEYRETNSTAMVVRDFMAGMTDEYFLSQCRKHLFPEIKVAPSQSYSYMD